MSISDLATAEEDYFELLRSHCEAQRFGSDLCWLRRIAHATALLTEYIQGARQFILREQTETATLAARIVECFDDQFPPEAWKVIQADVMARVSASQSVSK